MAEPETSGTAIALPSAPARAGSLPALPAALAGPLAGLRANPLFARAALPLLGISAATIGLFVWLFLTPPDRAPLYSGLPEAEKAAVVEALEAQGFPVALDPASGAVVLPPEDHARARMLLAAAGLPRAAPATSDLLADLPLGTSRAVEGARLKAAQERELARSIESLQGVEAARVLLAQPDPSPFIRDRAPVTASVTVTLAAGRQLSEGQARAIVHLVAGAVPGLSPDAVAIADQSGRLLSGEPGSARERGEDRRLAMQARLEARAREAILQLLVPIVGADNVTAQVAIELDFAAREAAAERFEPNGSLRSEAVTRSSSSQPRAMGIPGALSNTVPAAATVTATPPPALGAPTASTEGAESSTRNFEVGRTVEVTSRSGGQIRRLTAAVAIRSDALGPPAGRARVMKDIEALVQGAVGYDASRGDRIAVAARTFAPPVEIAAPIWREPVVVESSKWLATALVAIALLAFVIRPLLRRAMQPPVPPTDAARLADGISGDALPSPRVAIDYAAKLAEARLIAATDTARATAVARRLLAEPPS